MNFPTEDGLTTSQPNTHHVLFVDDEQDILPEYQEFFGFAGFTTVTCSDPYEAFALVLNTPEIGVVITDMRMAMLDGSSLIRDLRAALPPERRVEFIILTGDAGTSAEDFIADVLVFLKPADTDALVAAIRSALARP